MRTILKAVFLLAVLVPTRQAWATSSAELYTAKSYGYGRFEARARLAAGDGVVSSIFLWKVGSEKDGAFWNELDFEKIGATCELETNAIYGKPAGNRNQRLTRTQDLCAGFHTYAYEWTPTAIVWLIDGIEVRRETGAVPQAYADNASAGMRIHFNLWPGDASFGGNFNPSILPLHEYVDWVQFSAYEAGAFALTWREDFNGSTLPDGLQIADWASPKNLSTNTAKNVNFINGYAVLSLTTDNATGPAGAMIPDGGATNGPDGGSSGSRDASAEGGTGTSDAARDVAAGNTDSGDAARAEAGGGAGGGTGSSDASSGGAAGVVDPSDAARGGAAGNVDPSDAARGGAGGGTNPSDAAQGGAAGRDSSTVVAGSTNGGTNNTDPPSGPAPTSGGCSVAPGSGQGAVLGPLGILGLALLHGRARRRDRRSTRRDA